MDRRARFVLRLRVRRRIGLYRIGTWAGRGRLYALAYSARVGRAFDWKMPIDKMVRRRG